MSVEEIIRKIESAPVPKVRKVACAFSGGVDSSLGIELLKRKYRAEEIVPITVDVGQGEQELEVARRHGEALGVKPIFIDAREEFANEWIAMAIKANSDYEGYPVSTSMTRQLIARKVAEKAVELGCDALLEGSSGKGNDQFRMHNVFTMFAPGLEILVPVRDFDLTRREEEELCRAWGVPMVQTITGGDDKTLWCRSIASGAVDLDQELPDDIWMWLKPPEKAKDEPTVVEIEFKEGVPVKLNGERLPLFDIVYRLNYIAGENGIGRIDMFEDGIMNLKSREIYEAPAAHVILALHRDLEQFCLTKDELMFKKMVDQKWAYMMYHGQAFHPLRYELEAFINESQRHVEGEYRVKLYKGTIEIMRRRSNTGLFAPELRSIKAKGFDQRMSRGAAHIGGLIYQVLAMRKRVK
ncbi:MAG: argininosuccinate synthase [Candidatus Hadarchaeales archaeon]